MTSLRNWFAGMLSQDRRKAARHAAPPLVAYYWNGAAPVAHGLRDISASGFYLLTEERWYLGTVVLMTLQRTDSGSHTPSGRSIAVQSRVIRWGEDGVGFRVVAAEAWDSRKTDVSKQKIFGNFVGQLIGREGGPRPH